MNLDDYFGQVKGLGILATADGEGRVNAAVYGRPHFIDGETVAFIMQDRLSHRNLQSNPSAAYLFKEDGGKYVGKRLYLTKTGEEKDSPLIAELKRHKSPETDASTSPASRFLVYFRIDRILPLIGDGGKKQPSAGR